jgi:hypothetical protein
MEAIISAQVLLMARRGHPPWGASFSFECGWLRVCNLLSIQLDGGFMPVFPDSLQ